MKCSRCGKAGKVVETRFGNLCFDCLEIDMEDSKDEDDESVITWEPDTLEEFYGE